MVRNGRLDRGVALPLEDLWLDGSPAGSVGQGIYGSGAAFAFATRAYHRIPGSGMMAFTEYPIADWRREGASFSFRLVGDPGRKARVRLVGDGGAVPASARIDGEPTEEAFLPGGSCVEIAW